MLIIKATKWSKDDVIVCAETQHMTFFDLSTFYVVKLFMHFYHEHEKQK